MKIKISFIITFFLLAVFLSVEKAGATSCGTGGTCVADLCKSTEKWDKGYDSQCNQAGGVGERCCTPDSSIIDAECCSSPSAAYLFCDTGFHKDPNAKCPVSNKKCCIADGTAPPATGGDKAAGANCNLTSECQSGLTCYKSSTQTSYTCQQIGLPTGPSGAAPAPASGGGWNLSNYSKFGLPESSIYGIISGILGWMLGILGLFGVIGFIIAGIIYLMSTGDEDMIERAKSAMKWSIVGVVVGLMGVVIIQAVELMLTGSSMF